MPFFNLDIAVWKEVTEKQSYTYKDIHLNYTFSLQAFIFEGYLLIYLNSLEVGKFLVIKLSAAA